MTAQHGFLVFAARLDMVATVEVDLVPGTPWFSRHTPDIAFAGQANGQQYDWIVRRKNIQEQGKRRLVIAKESNTLTSTQVGRLLRKHETLRAATPDEFMALLHKKSEVRFFSERDYVTLDNSGAIQDLELHENAGFFLSAQLDSRGGSNTNIVSLTMTPLVSPGTKWSHWLLAEK